jgi:hypothetical protein
MRIVHVALYLTWLDVESRQGVAQTALQSSSDKPSGGKDSPGGFGGLYKSQETTNIFSGVIWTTAG